MLGVGPLLYSFADNLITRRQVAALKQHADLVKQPTGRQVVNVGARSLLALLFAISAVAKLLDLNQFSQRVGDFGLVYDGLVAPTAWGIVGAESLTSISLALNLRRGLGGAVVLLLLFIGVLTYGITLGLDIECGCFGPAIHVSLSTQLLTDFGLLLVCAIIYWSDAGSRSPIRTDHL